ncbi:putative 2OG-Fe(II) oxygenase [Stakelama saccharophila]|uniref:2OG-Fe(II) oxygenase n=1 Tax=Stakelama saccharophila TaxID=3075605 RepID=A0ABZ0BBU5_9SPHN|nr:putative 2OG-Fe(II) oxygenase [Stakelama sp. W311]WNO54677.1 putative 2OG-Fe(II) oxygenase [Stakelama sp. W311]
MTAELEFERARSAMKRDKRGHAALEALARAALPAWREADAIGPVEAEARRSGSARLWQWTALLHRGLDAHDKALEAFARAADIAPEDPGIAHGRARIAFEAGLPASALYARACALKPKDPDLILGLTAAEIAEGRSSDAIARLSAIVARSPAWPDGHRRLAELRWMMGEHRDFADATYEALRARPANDALWSTLLQLFVQAELYEPLEAAIAAARDAVGDKGYLLVFEAVLFSETGRHAAADAAFAALAGARPDPSIALRHVRHLLRTGRPAEATRAIDPWLDTAAGLQFYPYAAAAWRLTGDERISWLEARAELVRVVDLAPHLPSLDDVATHLQALHRARSRHLDQSVRGGSQTDGNLFQRIDPIIRQLRDAVASAVSDHVADLPAVDAEHPVLGVRRDLPVRFSGAWSVRLAGGGHHANHVHPAGWLSSALYVALPERQPGEAADSGWLTLGEPPTELGLALEPLRRIEPKPGRLVLFPSTMWHGTRPFAKGERLTVAFDVARPPG